MMEQHIFRSRKFSEVEIKFKNVLIIGKEVRSLARKELKIRLEGGENIGRLLAHDKGKLFKREVSKD